MKVADLVLVVATATFSCSPANVASPTDAGANADTGLGDDGGKPYTQACLDRGYAYCTQLQSCSSTAVTIRYGDVTTCKKIYAAQCEAAFTNPGGGATVAQVEACATAEATWACNDIIYTQNPPPACANVAGPGANGTPCIVGSQCQSTWCSHPEGHACGVCDTTPVAGSSCASSTCPAPLSCSTTNVCVSYVEVGNQCSASAPCDSGLTCVGGICQAGVTALNAPCIPAGPGCDLFSGLACNAQTNTCKTLVLATGGQACGQVANQPDACEMGACPRGTCVAYAGIGETCDTVAGPACAVSLRCIYTSDAGTSGTCQISGTGSCP